MSYKLYQLVAEAIAIRQRNWDITHHSKRRKVDAVSEKRSERVIGIRLGGSTFRFLVIDITEHIEQALRTTTKP